MATTVARCCLASCTFLCLLSDAVRLRQNSSQRRPLIDEPQLPYCIYPNRGEDAMIRVFVSPDNSRQLQFGEHNFGTQTSVECTNSVSGSCASRERAQDLSKTPSCVLKQDCVCERDNSKLPFLYMKRIMEEMQPMCTHSEHPFRVMLIGLGGGALPSYILEHCPRGSRVESVDHDARVVEAASNFFGLKLEKGKNEVEVNDAEKAVQDRLDRGDRASYDVILVDCFGADDMVPASCRSPALVTGMRKLLRPQGKVIQQVWGRQLKAVEHVYKDAFGNHAQTKPCDGLGASFLLIGSAAS